MSSKGALAAGLLLIAAFAGCGQQAPPDDDTQIPRLIVHRTPVPPTPVEHRPASPPPGLSAAEVAAYQALSDATFFAYGPVGYDAVTPEAVPAFQLLLASPHASEAFAALAAEKDDEVRLYGICGLYYANPRLFLPAVQALKSRNPIIQMMEGCIGHSEPVADILYVPGSSTVRLTATTDTLDLWNARNPTAQHVDVIGGGYPEFLRTYSIEKLIKEEAKSKAGAAATPAPAIPTPAPHALNPAEAAAVGVIANASYFAVGCVAIHCTTPPQITAFQILLNAPHAEKAFNELISAPNPVARIYGACGLYYANPRALAWRAQAVYDENPTIPTMAGCSESDDSARSLLFKSEDGIVRLSSTSDTLPLWMSRHGGPRKGDLQEDIIGGGIPEALRLYHSSTR